jgi:hypothetical protein
VQPHFGPIQHLQQFRLVGPQPRQQPIQRGEPGAAVEDALAPQLQRHLLSRTPHARSRSAAQSRSSTLSPCPRGAGEKLTRERLPRSVLWNARVVVGWGGHRIGGSAATGEGPN